SHDYLVLHSFPTRRSSDLILDQNAEARMYGIYLAIASLLILQFQINNLTNCRTRGLLISNACINGALVHTHLFGSFYSGAFLVEIEEHTSELQSPDHLVCR